MPLKSIRKFLFLCLLHVSAEIPLGVWLFSLSPALPQTPHTHNTINLTMVCRGLGNGKTLIFTAESGVIFVGTNPQENCGEKPA